MKIIKFPVILICFSIMFSFCSTVETTVDTDIQKIQIGVYDSREVAIAYARGEYFEGILEELKTEYKNAEESGNEELVQKLDSIGQASQDQLHKQVFSTMPIDNILKLINIEEIADKAEVDLIVCRWDIIFEKDDIEYIDVTGYFVEFFSPDSETQSILEEVKKTEPIPLEFF